MSDVPAEPATEPQQTDQPVFAEPAPPDTVPEVDPHDQALDPTPASALETPSPSEATPTEVAPNTPADERPQVDEQPEVPLDDVIVTANDVAVIIEDRHPDVGTTGLPAEAPVSDEQLGDEPPAEPTVP